MAGVPALLIGVVAMALTAGLCVLASVHLDGVIDAHCGPALGWPPAFGQSLFNWLVLSAVLMPFALWLARPGWRLIDLLGIQALARAPFALVAGVMLGLRMLVDLPDLPALMQEGQTPSAADNARLFVHATVTLVPLAWSIYLMYRSFAICVDATTDKVIGAFIAALVIAEVVSKVACGLLFQRLYGA